MILLPSLTIILVSFQVSNATARQLNLGPALFLGRRDDKDRESVRLHKAISRKMKIGAKAIAEDERLVTECRRYHRDRGVPEAALEARKRPSPPGFWDFGEIGLMWCENPECRVCEYISDVDQVFANVEPSKGDFTSLYMLPWSHLSDLSSILKGARNEKQSVGYCLEMDVLGILWLAAYLVLGHRSDREALVRKMVPPSIELTGHYFVEFLLLIVPVEKTAKPGPRSRYLRVANFLVPDNHPDVATDMRRLIAEELSVIDRGKKRLSGPLVGRYRDLFSEALILRDAEERSKRGIPALVYAYGEFMGSLEHIVYATLPMIEAKSSEGDLGLRDRFNSTLKKWPKVVRSFQFPED